MPCGGVGWGGRGEGVSKSTHKLILLSLENILNSEYIQMYILCKFILEDIVSHTYGHMSFLHTCFKCHEREREKRVLSILYKYFLACTKQFLMSIRLHHKSISISLKHNGIKLFIMLRWNRWDVRCSFACLTSFDTLLNTHLACMIRWWQCFTHRKWHQ